MLGPSLKSDALGATQMQHCCIWVCLSSVFNRKGVIGPVVVMQERSGLAPRYHRRFPLDRELERV